MHAGHAGGGGEGHWGVLGYTGARLDLRCVMKAEQDTAEDSRVDWEWRMEDPGLSPRVNGDVIS